MKPERRRLDQLTRRWRSRHDARHPLDPEIRPPAAPEREEQARSAFPFRDTSPAEYVARHGAAMVGFTYDDHVYADPDLDAWLREVGALLRAQRPWNDG